MRIVRNAFALSALLCLLASPADAEEQYFNNCIRSCNVHRVDDLGQEGAGGKHVSHYYSLIAHCEGYFSGKDTITTQQFGINGNYSPLSKIGTEKIWVKGPNATEAVNAIESSFRCDSDPWRGGAPCANMGVRATHTTSSSPAGTVRYEVDWKLCHGSAVPASRQGRDKILAAIEQKKQTEPLPAPIFVSPASEAALPNHGDVIVEVKPPPKEGWFTDYRYPEVVALEWWYLGPDDGQHDPEQKQVIAEVTGVSEAGANRVARAERLAEGRWRIAARLPASFAPGQQRASSEREFWIGDKVSSARAPATIVVPADGSLHAGDPVHARVNYRSAGSTGKPKTPSASSPSIPGLPVEVQWVAWSEKNGAWSVESAVIREHPSNQEIELLKGGEGKFRIRARGRSSAEYKAPWSPWTVYYVGQRGADLKQMGTGAEAAPAFARGAGKISEPDAKVSPGMLPPPPGVSATVAANRVRVRLLGVLAAPEYGLGYQQYDEKKKKWLDVAAPGYDRLHPPDREIQVPKGIFGTARRARVRARAEQPQGNWGFWEEFNPDPRVKSPAAAPGVGAPPSKPRLKTLPR